MFFLIALPLALLPSLIWLLFYFRKDIHPEPKRLVLRIFLLSMLATSAIVAIILETEVGPAKETWQRFFREIFPPIFFIPLIGLFLNAFWEELAKYLVVRFSILRNPEFDEPVDAMEYMIISALGFAAVENILVAIRYKSVTVLLSTLFVRFLGATLLHALSSAVVGFFLARAIFWKKNRRRYPLRLAFVFLGLLIATCLHGSFNFLIIVYSKLQTPIFLYLVVAFLLLLAFFVSRAFRRLNQESLYKRTRN